MLKLDSFLLNGIYFKQEPEPIDWEYYRKGIGARVVDMYKEAYDSEFYDLILLSEKKRSYMTLVHGYITFYIFFVIFCCVVLYDQYIGVSVRDLTHGPDWISTRARGDEGRNISKRERKRDRREP